MVHLLLIRSHLLYLKPKINLKTQNPNLGCAQFLTPEKLNSYEK